ncbi:TRAP transporter substrate-binding protein DctP [Halalkalibacter sp. APA_J-10(15)]|uniref:TRAP transporter substrate-binding protein DctP n=1 Tax=unclassified Halalkalibacter TaxID=2893063 RepID=UPI001FF0F532|nr:TRAP transporter substrate-binding protein DctP [Halalkalibacter sp. APA_J-10(15)]MCK0472707.1 TRAP transporter substrate-binding protein DctP [Halalkalibacter sp. APA_J-10(15)]
MFFKKKGWKAFAVAGALSVALAACGGEDTDSDVGEDPVDPDTNGDETPADEGSDGAAIEESYHWDFVTEEVDGQVQYEYAQQFADLLEEKSDGQITMDVWEYGAFGGATEVDQVESLQMGDVEFAIVSPGFTGGMVPEGQVFALHFLFPDDLETTQEILNTSEALNVHLAEMYEAQSIKPLAFFTEGAMQWTGNRELRTPDDFNGFQMRTQESPLIMSSYEAYGADPAPLSWGELYLALDRGNRDGQENPIFFIEDAEFHRVQDHMTISNHNNYVAMTTVNPNFYNELPDNVRALIDETVEEMQPIVFDLQDGMNETYLDSIIDDTEYPTEVITLTEEEREAFRELALPIRDEFRDTVGEDGAAMLDLLEEEIAAFE